MILLGLVLLVLSGVSATFAAFAAVCHANPRTTLPWLLRRPAPRTPRLATALLAIACGTGVLGMFQFFDSLGYWSPLLIFAAWAGAFVVQYNHNREVLLR